MLPTTEVLEKMKLTSKVESASKLKAEQTFIGNHVDKAALWAQVQTFRSKFGIEARNFLVFILNQVLVKVIPNNSQKVQF